MPWQAVQRKLPWADSCEYHRCSVCGAPQPTARLLDVHLSEMHDSFFAAQAARKLKVRRGSWHAPRRGLCHRQKVVRYTLVCTITHCDQYVTTVWLLRII